MPSIRPINSTSRGLTQRPFRFFGLSGINSPSNLFGPGFDVFSQYSSSPIGYFGFGSGPVNSDYWSWATESPYASNYLRSRGLFRGDNSYNLLSSLFFNPFSFMSSPFFGGGYSNSNYSPYTGPTILDQIFNYGYSTSGNLSNQLGRYDSRGSYVDQAFNRANTYIGGTNNYLSSYGGGSPVLNNLWGFTSGVINSINNRLLGGPSPGPAFNFNDNRATDFVAFQIVTNMPISIKIEFDPPKTVTKA